MRNLIEFTEEKSADLLEDISELLHNRLWGELGPIAHTDGRIHRGILSIPFSLFLFALAEKHIKKLEDGGGHKHRDRKWGWQLHDKRVHFCWANRGPEAVTHKSNVGAQHILRCTDIQIWLSVLRGFNLGRIINYQESDEFVRFTGQIWPNCYFSMFYTINIIKNCVVELDHSQCAPYLELFHHIVYFDSSMLLTASLNVMVSRTDELNIIILHIL